MYSLNEPLYNIEIGIKISTVNVVFVPVPVDLILPHLLCSTICTDEQQCQWVAVCVCVFTVCVCVCVSYTRIVLMLEVACNASSCFHVIVIKKYA